VNLDSPEVWRWIWIVTAAVLLVGEMLTPGAFFFLPFAVGAFVAAITAFAGASVGLEWAVFVGASAAAFAALWPLGRRLDRSSGGVFTGVGANRLVGKQAVVLEDIPGLPQDTGLVRVEREQWKAESLTGQRIRSGSTVLVARVDGTRLVVTLLEEPEVPLSDPGELPPARS
jgi:membrane protein implicated in regulation of membrane protease activity